MRGRDVRLRAGLRQPHLARVVVDGAALRLGAVVVLVRHCIRGSGFARSEARVFRSSFAELWDGKFGFGVLGKGSRVFDFRLSIRMRTNWLLLSAGSS